MKKYLIIPILLSVFCGKTNGQEAAKCIAKIDSLLQLYASFDALNGSVLVAQHDSVIYRGAFGKANSEWEIPNTIETRFGIASISKLFTAVTILQLSEQGKINLQQPLSNYLTDWKSKPAGKITLEQLLLHTGGITDTRFIPGFDLHYGVQQLSRDDFFQLFADSALFFEPGTAWSYTNFGYNLLARVAEKVSGKNYQQLLHECIFEPAGMRKSTTFQETHALPQMASPYEMRYGDIWKGKYVDASTTIGSGDVITTIDDYYRFMQGLKNGTLLSAKSFKQLTQPYTTLSGEKTGYALWFDAFPLGKDTVQVIRTAGTMYGWNSVSYTIPEDGFQLVLLLNITNSRMFEIADKLTELCYDVPIDLPKDTYAHILFKEAPLTGIDKAIVHFKELKAKNCCLSHFRHLNRLGYHYLENGNVDWALKVFLLNTEIYPEDAGVYDSLGEAYMVQGDKTKAIENYSLSLKMDPANDNAANMLRLLQP